MWVGVAVKVVEEAGAIEEAQRVVQIVSSGIASGAADLVAVYLPWPSVVHVVRGEHGDDAQRAVVSGGSADGGGSAAVVSGGSAGGGGTAGVRGLGWLRW